MLKSRPMPATRGNAIFLEEFLDAVGKTRNHLRLPGHHHVEVDGSLSDRDSVPFRLMPQHIEKFGRIEECLRRDAAYVETGTSERRVRLDARRLQPELARPNRGDVAAWTTAYDDEVGMTARTGP